MTILISNHKDVDFASNDIIFGTYENEEKWALYDADGNITLYVLDNGYEALEVKSIPDDFIEGKYCYIDGEFTINPYWVEPEPTLEERITSLETQMVDTVEAQADIFEELIFLELGLE